MAKQLYDYTKREILKEALKNRVVDLRKPADLARLTAVLILTKPERKQEIQFMVSLLQKVWAKLPKEQRPKLPHESLEISGVEDDPSKSLCKLTPDGKKICISPVEVAPSSRGKDNSLTPWKVIQNKAGKLFIQIGPIVIAAVVFAAFLFGGWMLGLPALVIASLAFPESTRKVIAKVADLVGFVLNQAGRAAKMAADAIGLTDLLLFAGVGIGIYFVMNANKQRS